MVADKLTNTHDDHVIHYHEFFKLIGCVKNSWFLIISRLKEDSDASEKYVFLPLIGDIIELYDRIYSL